MILVCVCVFIKLHITTQSGPVILVILCRVCVCVCVFIKLHITAQSGPVILVILCHLLRKPLIRRDKGDTISLLVQILLEP